MVTLLAMALPNITFQDLTGAMIEEAAPDLSTCEQEQRELHQSSTPDPRMRIHLPDGAVRVMTLTEYQEFMQSYRIVDVRTCGQTT